eukprot:1161064-Pelagomonas_calceolata.AAC.10
MAWKDARDGMMLNYCKGNVPGSMLYPRMLGQNGCEEAPAAFLCRMPHGKHVPLAAAQIVLRIYDHGSGCD